MDHDVLMAQMEERFREEFANALEALQDAPDEHWIEASEMAFRGAALTVGREGLELALQARVDANPTALRAGETGEADQERFKAELDVDVEI